MIANRIQKFMDVQGVRYETLEHPLTYTATQSAQVSHISGENLAKAVLLRDDKGYLLAVLPATRHIQMDRLSEWLGFPVHLASEEDAAQIFPDCLSGAIPPVGAAYGLRNVVDEALDACADVWFEGGDHRFLLHVRGGDFERLMSGARHGRFSRHDG